MQVASTPPMVVFSCTNIPEEEQELKNHMAGLQVGSPEYQYDQLHLEREERELQIRSEHPDLDPLSVTGCIALQKIMSEDRSCKNIDAGIYTLTMENPSECTKWGIPMGQTKGMAVPKSLENSLLEIWKTEKKNSHANIDPKLAAAYEEMDKLLQALNETTIGSKQSSQLETSLSNLQREINHLRSIDYRPTGSSTDGATDSSPLAAENASIEKLIQAINAAINPSGSSQWETSTSMSPAALVKG